MAIAHDFKLPISNERDLADFIRLAFGVCIPDVQVCPNHTTPWHAFCDAYFARYPVSVWKGSRGFGGKSFMLALLGMVEALTLGADVNILGGSGTQSQRVLQHMQRFWRYEDAPRNYLSSDPTKQLQQFKFGNTVQALMASQASVRGPHPERLRLDEVDEMDLAILDAAMGQPMSAPGIPAQTVMSSTHQYPSGTMTEMLKRAVEKSWPVYTWCYKETSAEPNGWLTQAEIDRKRGEITETMWKTEYDLQEPDPGSLAINQDAVKRMFRKDLGEYEGRPEEYIAIEPPIEGGQYATGADWARKQDWTIIVTWRIDVKPVRLIAFERTGRLSWPVMIGKFNDRINHYGGAAAHDGTGIGDVVAGYISSYAEGVIMVGMDRKGLLSNYIGAVERGELEAPYIRFMESEHRLASWDDVYGTGHLPDTISAGALAYKCWAKFGVSAGEWVKAYARRDASEIGEVDYGY